MSLSDAGYSARGDFQTPVSLAELVWDQVNLKDLHAVIEPTVGRGAFLTAAPASARSAKWLCLDIDNDHVRKSQEIAMSRGIDEAKIEVANAFMFSEQWLDQFDREAPILAIGNPPWVTSAAIGRMGLANLPERSNRTVGFNGFDALTGKSNFDIAEAILLRVIEALRSFKEVELAFLIKWRVATRLAKRLLGTAQALSFSRIDASDHFGVSVDAGLFQVRLLASSATTTPFVAVAEQIGAPPVRKAGLVDGGFVEDLTAHRAASCHTAETPVTWRQGLKHDLARVLELRPMGNRLKNGFDELVRIESGILCPLYKSSDLANDRSPGRLFPLYQHDLSGPPSDLDQRWPLLAAYLESYDALFAARRSRIYHGKHRFALFGVGPYSLAPWKVAVSGFYFPPRFKVIGPSSDGCPPLVDDTCYLLPFATEMEANTVADYLNGDGPQSLIAALSDPRAKRPITKAILAKIAVPVAPLDLSIAPQLFSEKAA